MTNLTQSLPGFLDRNGATLPHYTRPLDPHEIDQLPQAHLIWATIESEIAQAEEAAEEAAEEQAEKIDELDSDRRALTKALVRFVGEIEQVILPFVDESDPAIARPLRDYIWEAKSELGFHGDPKHNKAK